MLAIDTVWCLAAAFFMLIVMYFCWNQVNKACVIRKELDILRAKAATYTERWATLNTHAADYRQSLGPEGTQECFTLTRLLGQVDNLISEAECLLDTRADREALAEAMRLLAYDSALSEKS